MAGKTIRFFFMVLVLALPGISRAEGSGLVISPPFKEVVINQDEATSQVLLSLTNRTAFKQTITVSSVDFKSLNESGGVAFLGQDASKLERKYGLTDWLSLASGSIDINANETKNIPVIIQNKSDLAPGGHYGAVLFRVVGDGTQNPNSVAIKQVFASLLFVKKLGGEKYDLNLDSLEKPKNWLKGNPVVGLKFRNSGNVHVVPRGTVEVISANKKVMAKANINPESGIILPEATRKYYSELLNVHPLRPGKYTLAASYRYDGTSEIKKLTQTIYIFDFRLAIAVGVACLGIVAVIFLIYRYWRYRRPLAK